MAVAEENPRSQKPRTRGERPNGDADDGEGRFTRPVVVDDTLYVAWGRRLTALQ